MGLEPGGGVQAHLPRGGEVPLCRHGHRVPRCCRQVEWKEETIRHKIALNKFITDRNKKDLNKIENITKTLHINVVFKKNVTFLNRKERLD